MDFNIAKPDQDTHQIKKWLSKKSSAKPGSSKHSLHHWHFPNHSTSQSFPNSPDSHKKTHVQLFHEIQPFHMCVIRSDFAIRPQDICEFHEIYLEKDKGFPESTPSINTFWSIDRWKICEAWSSDDCFDLKFKVGNIAEVFDEYQGNKFDDTHMKYTIIRYSFTLYMYIYTYCEAGSNYSLLQGIAVQEKLDNEKHMSSFFVRSSLFTSE